MLEELRAATRRAHERLETGLGLLSPPLTPARFGRVIQGFHAFHRTWEPQVEALLGASAFLTERRRLPLLERDLAALQLRELDRSPALGFLSGPAEAWGSLYVMEGSTLGGQVIAKALRSASWVPAGGLAYFNPYGRRTAAMWSSFREELATHTAGQARDRVVRGACATFDTLHGWLCRDLAPEALGQGGA